MSVLQNYNYRKKLTIDSTKIDSDLTDFPILVKLEGSNFNFNNSEVNGADIKFTLDDGVTLLKFERERHISPNAEYWVKIPLISSSIDTDIYIYYGNSLASDTEDPNNVWDGDFKAVYHMDSGLLDSTINGYDLTDQGTSDVEGKISKARDFIRSESDRIDIPLDVSNLSSYSIELIFKRQTQWDSGASTEEFLFQRRESDSDRAAIRLQGDGKLRHFNSSNGVGLSTTQSVWSADTDYHIMITNDGSSECNIYVNGVLDAIDTTSIGGLDDVNANLSHLGSQFFSSSYQSHFNGIIDEVRFSSILRTAPWVKATYNSNFNTLLTYNNEENLFAVESENLEISDEIIVIDTSVIENESIEINDSIQLQETTVNESDNLQILDEIIVSFTNTDAKFVSKIISINPLIFITDTNPVELVKIDTSIPETPSWIVQTISNLTNASDISIDVNDAYIYIAGNNGKIIKIEIADLGNQQTIDVSDSDNLITIETNKNFGITYAGTDNVIGELYILDERDTFLINSDFTALSPKTFKIHSDFNTVNIFRLTSAFNCLSQQTFKMHSDFKCLTKPTVTPPIGVNRLDVIEPIKETDYHVFLDNVELENTDIVLNSIVITHSIGEESRASFRLTRKHDDFNRTLDGVTRTITNNNEIYITCNGRTIFPFNGIGTGRISNISGVYDNNTEYADIIALGEEAPNKFNNITMSLPELNSRLSLYDILLQNPQINNPYIDPTNEENPKKYKGIRVDLGTKIEQHISRFTFFDSLGTIADKIQEGTFNPLKNSTYFWSPTVTKVGVTSSDLGQILSQRFFYIGTSLAPVTEDLWDLTNAYHWRQKILVDTEEELGNYEIGEAPFDTISIRNGQKITKYKFIDEPNGLYTVKEAGYNFIEYAKQVADLEYENLKNINGDILPDTSASFTMTIDAFLYYDISLLTRINIDNTTQTNIYKNTNGFPLGIKSISIKSSDRKVQIQADNAKSSIEINNQFPDEEDDEYNEPEIKKLIHLKTDMRTRLQVE